MAQHDRGRGDEAGGKERAESSEAGATGLAGMDGHGRADAEDLRGRVVCCAAQDHRRAVEERHVRCVGREGGAPRRVAGLMRAAV